MNPADTRGRRERSWWRCVSRPGEHALGTWHLPVEGGASREATDAAPGHGGQAQAEGAGREGLAWGLPDVALARRSHARPSPGG